MSLVQRATVIASFCALLLVLASAGQEFAHAASAYKLPVPSGQAVYVTQGNWEGDHRPEYGNSQFAFDFASNGTSFPIVTARAGKIVGLRADSDIRCKGLNIQLDGTPLKGCWAEANYILVDHGDGSAALYLHLAKDSVAVRNGDRVQRGQQIGMAGTTGWSTGIHLHFQAEVTPCAQGSAEAIAQCQQRKGWWWNSSLAVSFEDTDVTTKSSDGVPLSLAQCNPQSETSKLRCNSYTSDNALPAQAGVSNGSQPDFRAPKEDEPSAKLHPISPAGVFFVDMGVPSSEANYQLQGWDRAEGPGVNPFTSPTGDTTKRFQRLRSDNTLAFAPVVPGSAYQLTAEVEDGNCTDNFQILSRGTLLYSFTGNHSSPTVIRTHIVTIPENVVADNQLLVTFHNTSTDDCGLAAVFNVNVQTVQGGSEPKTRAIFVDPTISPPGVDSGIDIVAGKLMTIAASGRSHYGYEGAGCVGSPETDADGQRYLDGSSCPPKIDTDATLPTAPIGALLARIGNGAWFLVGGKYTAVANAGGRLFLLYNDTTRGDNTNGYNVTVTVSP